jgi:hypothetical protein
VFPGGFFSASQPVVPNSFKKFIEPPDREPEGNRQQLIRSSHHFVWFVLWFLLTW